MKELGSQNKNKKQKKVYKTGDKDTKEGGRGQENERRVKDYLNKPLFLILLLLLSSMYAEDAGSEMLFVVVEGS
jgi:hypothetical protein